MRKLKLGSALLGATLQVVPLRLQRTKFVDGQHLRKLVRARGQLFVLARAIDLTLQRSQLTGDFLIDVAGTHQVLVHRLNLFERSLLAALVLGNAGGLLDEARRSSGRLCKMASSLPWLMMECVSLPRPESCRMS